MNCSEFVEQDIDKPYIPKMSVSPNIKKNIILAGVISLFAGIFLAFFME